MVWKIATAGRESAVFFAAQELARCLGKMDRECEVAVLTYRQYRPEISEVLWLGVCPQVQAEVETPEMDDAYWIDVENGCGAIRGSNARSVLFGAYRFLRELGCTWVRPGAENEFIPARSTENVVFHTHEKASYRHRGICIEGAVSYGHVRDTIDWMPKHSLNAYYNQFNNPVTFYRRWYEHVGNPLMEPAAFSSAEIEGLRDSSVEELKKRGMLYHAAGHGWTCEPFGIKGEAWEPAKEEIPAGSVKYLAKVNGKRELWGGIALNTNLCYSNAAVRRTIASAVAERCADKPEIDLVHVWLADGSNNQCECPSCRKMRPSDWYVMLLNEIDAQLEKKKLKTKVVFLIYVDLLWEPKQVTLRNPDRFVLMFAPITRTYSASIADAPEFPESQLPEFQRNRLAFPKSVDENLAWLKRWQKQFSGDSFVYDYHFMWDHFLDPGYYSIADTLFRDMQSLHKVGINGMISCQNQRVFFPTGLGMTAMAAALWNEKADFDTAASDYFRSAYGDDGETVKCYLRSLSEAFDPPYLRGEKPFVNAASAASFASVQEILKQHAGLIAGRAADRELPESVRRSWEYLSHHAVLCSLLAKSLQKKAEGNFADAKVLMENVSAYAREHESVLHHALDVCFFQQVLEGAVRKGMND